MRAAISVATSQDWKTFRWLRLTLIDDPLGDMICTRIRELSDSVLCVGRHNYSPSENWPEKFAQVWSGTHVAENIELSGQEVQVTWHLFSKRMSINTKNEIETVLNGSFSIENSIHVDVRRH